MARLPIVIHYVFLSMMMVLGLFQYYTLGVQAQQTTTASASPTTGRKINVDQIKLGEGYRIEPVITQLSVPTTAIFAGEDLLVAESGTLNTAPARILRITPSGAVSVEAEAGLLDPVTGLAVINGRLYVSHKGKVSVVEKEGQLRDIVTGLPSDGDHHNNTIVAGPDGKIYLGQGTVTNSAVVGEDNYLFGWLKADTATHEVPCQDISLRGTSFVTNSPFDGAEKQTGAYKSYGQPGQAGEVIKGQIPCGGSIVRFNPDGSGMELVAWGLRNPFGLAFDGSGQLWATSHGADVRGSRPIYNDPDYLVKVEQGAWYGWPEFFDGQPVIDNRFSTAGYPKPDFLWQTHPSLKKAFLTFDSHAGANGLTFSPGGSFGLEGYALVAMFGTFEPVTTGPNLRPEGFQVVGVDIANSSQHPLVGNTLPGPAYLNQGGGLNRPSSVVFGPDQSLYVVDIGAATLDSEGLKFAPQTGVVWRVYSTAQTAQRPDGPVKINAAVLPPPAERETLVRNVPQLYQSLLPLLERGIVIILGAALIWWLFHWVLKRTTNS